MTTSRTGTAVHKRMRRIVLAEAKASGQTRCPACGTELNFDPPHRSTNSPHADEITPYALRGFTSTDPNDWQVLCARCNQRKGARVVTGSASNTPYPPSRSW